MKNLTNFDLIFIFNSNVEVKLPSNNGWDYYGPDSYKELAADLTLLVEFEMG